MAFIAANLKKTTPSQLQDIQERYTYQSTDSFDDILSEGYFLGAFDCSACFVVVDVTAGVGWFSIVVNSDTGSATSGGDSGTSIVKAQTLADAVTLTPLVPINSVIQTVEYNAGTGIGGNTYQSLDAGSSGARPTPIQGIYTNIGADGLYLAAVDVKNVSLQTLGLTDSDDAGPTLNALLALSPKRIYSDLPVTIKLSDGIDYSNKTIEWDMTNIKIINESNTPSIRFDGGIDSILAVSSVVPSTRRINLTSTGIKVGEIVKLIADDRLPFTRPAVGLEDNRMGQMFTVSSVATGYIIVHQKFDTNQAFATNMRLVRYSGHTIKVIGGDMSYDASITAENSSFYITNAIRPVFERMRFGPIPFVGLNIFGCYSPEIISPIFNATDDSTNLSHNISFWACAYPKITGLVSTKCRHSFTTNQQPIVADSDEVQYYGPTYGMQVTGAIADGDFDSAFDTHHGIYSGTFTDLRVISSTQGGVSVRGNNLTYNNLIIENAETNGVLIFSEDGVDPSDYTSNITLNNCNIHSDTLPLQINKCNSVKISGTISADDFKAIIATDSVVDFYDLTINMIGTANSGVSLIESNASTLRFHGTTTVNCPSHSGTISKLATLTGLNPVVTFDKIIINGNVDFPDFIFSSSSATNAYALALDVNVVSGPASISTKTGTFNASTAAYFYGALTNQSFFNTLTTSEVITLNSVGAPVVTVRAGAASNVTGIEIEDGLFVGQVIEIENTTTSFTISFPNAGNVVNNGAATFVLAGKTTAQWRWTNGVWRQL